MSLLQTIAIWTMWAIGVGIFLAWFGGYVYPRVAWWSRQGAYRMARSSPSVPYTLRRAVLYFFLIALTVTILHFPHWSPWSEVVDARAANQPEILRLLAPAAALLALLLFAVTQMRALEKENAQGESYLSQNLTTYLALRSWPVRIFDLPLFVGMTLLLFLVPLLVGALPQTAPADWPEWAPWAQFSLYQIALSLWCACFGVVGAVLLLNAINALRLSTDAALRPLRLRQRVAMELRRESIMRYERMLTDRDADQLRDTEAWAARHLDVARALPTDEQRLYLESTISHRTRYLFERGRTATLQRRVQRLAARATQNGPRGPSLRESLAAWREEQHLDAFRRALTDQRNALWGLTRAMLREFADPDAPQVVRTWLFEECLHIAIASDRDTARLGGASDQRSEESEAVDEFHGLSALERTARLILTHPVDGIHRISDSSTYWRHPMDTATPHVVRVSASIVLELSGILFDGNRPLSDAVEIRMLADNAARLQDRPTRSFAEATIARHAIDHVARASTDEDAVVVLEFGKDERRGHRGLWSSARSPSEREPNLVDHMETAAMNRLLNSDLPTGDAIARLLTLVRDWRAPASLLHALFSRRRSREHMPVSQVVAFREALASLRYADDAERIEVETTRFLVNSGNVGHFVHPELVHWLFGALRQRLTVKLCADFLEQMEQPFYSDFTLVEFVNWHVSAADPSSRDFFGGGTAAEGERSPLALASARTIIELADGWEELAPGETTQLSELAYRVRGLAPPVAVPALIDPSGFV